MVQKRVTAQGWLGSTPEGQRPQIRGLRAGGSLAVASSIPATQLSSPARLAERVVTPHTPRPNDVGGPTTFPGRQKGGDPAASGDLRLGHAWRRASIPLHALTTFLSALGAFCLFEPRVARICLGNLRYMCSDNGNASQGADDTSVRARGVLSVGISRFLDKSQHFTVHLFRPLRPGSARGSDGGPRRFTEVVPTPHAYSGQWPVKTKRARARSCASVVTRKRPSLNRAAFPLQDDDHLLVFLRYVERNPLHAGLIGRAKAWGGPASTATPRGHWPSGWISGRSPAARSGWRR